MELPLSGGEIILTTYVILIQCDESIQKIDCLYILTFSIYPEKLTMNVPILTLKIHLNKLSVMELWRKQQCRTPHA
jgi:hypothetical protein